MSFLRLAFPALLAALVVCQSGCGKSTEEAVEEPAAAEEAAPAAAPLAGTAEVDAALERKDWQGAIAALATAKSSMTEGQQQEYRDLRFKVQDALVSVMADDPAAAEAYKVLRIMETGR